MVTEGEKNESELRQIRLQNTVMMDIQFSQYVLTPAFNNEFKRIQKKICKECGRDYRITHWCEPREQQIWILDWETLLRANFKPEKRDISVYQLEEYENQPYPSNLANPPPKKEKAQQQIPVSKPQPIPIINTSSVNYNQPTRLQSTLEPQMKKLSVQSITQLTPRERMVYEELKNWRNFQANRERKPVFNIAVDTALMAVVFYRVATTHELMQISGFTTHSAQQYGTDILRIMIRNGMATGIKTYQQKRKPLPTAKPADTVTHNRKIIAGFACCFVLVVTILVITQFL
ncbi:MAG: hypothetical protein EU530_01180 [Promethearchaeota archaeon]|nr:MAG: hypothetical protein EU530_01180 [Candidatus Lokiarchaeota archaeon]